MSTSETLDLSLLIVAIYVLSCLYPRQQCPLAALICPLALLNISSCVLPIIAYSSLITHFKMRATHARDNSQHKLSDPLRCEPFLLLTYVCTSQEYSTTQQKHRYSDCLLLWQLFHCCPHPIKCTPVMCCWPVCLIACYDST